MAAREETCLPATSSRESMPPRRKRLEQLSRLVSDDVLKPASEWSAGESRPALHPPDLSLETLIPGVADKTEHHNFLDLMTLAEVLGILLAL